MTAKEIRNLKSGKAVRRNDIWAKIIKTLKTYLLHLYTTIIISLC